MKKLTILIAILITTMSFAQVPSYVPTNGLVGWWPFNGNANDESGNGDNGTVNGSALTSDRFGNSNTAYNFDGIDDFIEFGDITSLDNASAFSVSVFFNYSNLPTFPNDWYTLVADGSYADLDGWGILIKSDQILMRELDNYNGLNLNYNFTQNNWYHVAATCESDSIKIFINGQFIGGYGNLQPTLTLNTTNSFRVGNGTLTNVPPNTWPYYLSGKIDDLGLWSRALTACEIQNLYTSELNATFVSAGADQTICNGQQVTLSGSNSQNYTWNNGVVDSISFSPTTTQDYIVTADSANCQSSDTVTVFVNESTSSTQNQTALDTYTWPINDQTYTQGGAYTATIPNAAGCDSLVTLNLTLNYTGINELIGSAVSISPNPTTSKITVKASLALIGKEFTIYDQQGKAVKSGIITAEETEIDLSNLSEGVYLFKAGGEMQETFKIIKQ
jgi:hypothetical protein